MDNSARRLLQALLGSLFVAAIVLPFGARKSDMTPNWFEVNFQTYLDTYDVTAEASRRGEKADEPDVAAEATREYGFFSDDLEDLRIVFRKKPDLLAEDLERAGRAERARAEAEAAEEIPHTWMWAGSRPSPKGIGYLVVEIAERDDLLPVDIEPADLTLIANGEMLEPVRRRAKRFYYAVEGEYYELNSLRIESEEALFPIRSVTILEREPQRVYFKELELMRDIAAFRYLYPLHAWDAGGMLQQFSAGTGAQWQGKHLGEFAELRPTDIRFELQYDGDWRELTAVNQRIGRPVRILVFAGAVFILGLVFYALYYFVPPLRSSSLRRLRPINLHAWFRWFTGRNLTTLSGFDLAVLLFVGVAVALQLLESGSLAFWASAAMMALSTAVILSGSSETASGRNGLREETSDYRYPHDRLAAWMRRHPDAAGLIGLALLAGFTAVTHLHRLGEPPMWVDEVFSFLPAQLILETGEPVYRETGYEYDRAYVYHWIVAQFMRWLGETPFAARVPNVGFNVGTLVVIYLFGKRSSRIVGLGAAALWATTNYVLALTRWVRMYPMFWFLFALSAYFFYRAVVDMPRPRINLQLGRFDLSFNPVYLALFVPTFLLAAETQLLAVVLVWGAALFFLVEFLIGQNRRRALVALLASIAVIFTAAYYRYGTIDLYEAYITRPTSSLAMQSEPKMEEVTEPLRTNLAFWFLFPGVVAGTLIKRNTLLRFCAAVAVAGILFIGLHYAQAERYWTMVIPFLWLSIGAFLWHLLVYRSRLTKAPLPILVLALLVAFAGLSHAQLFVQELGETMPYPKASSIMVHGKRDHSDKVDYLQLYQTSKSKLMSDVHVSLIFAADNVPVDGVILEQRRKEAGAWDDKQRTRHNVPVFWFDQLGTFHAAEHGFLVLRREEDSISSIAGESFIRNKNFDYGVIFVPPLLPPR